MKIKELANSISEYCKKNPFYCILVVVAEILAFGFQASHYTYHIDMLVEEYYNGTVLIAAGRFSAPIINFFTNWMQFAPFWHTAVMAIILFVSGLILGIVLKKISGDKLSDSMIFAFWIMFATFPIIVHQMTYPILSVVLPYLFIGIAFWLLLPMFFVQRVSVIRMIAAVLLLVGSVDMYESHASVFLTMYFALLFVKYWQNKDSRDNFKKAVALTIKVCLILVVAIVLDFIISKIVCRIACGTFDFWYQTNTSVAWMDSSPVKVLKWLIRELIAQYVIAGVSNYCVFMYDAAIVIGGIIAIALSFRRRNWMLVLLYAGACVASMALAIVIGSAPEYRMAQSLPVLVALFLMIIVCIIPKKASVKGLVWCIIGIIIMNQTMYINRYTVLNYERYEYENNILQNISHDLKLYPVDEKPVLFIYGEENDFPDFESTPLDLNNPFAEKYEEIMCKVFDKIIPSTTFKRLDAKFGHKVDYDLSDSAGVSRYFNQDYKILPYIRFNTRTNSPKAETGRFIPEIYRAFDKKGLNLLVDSAALSNDGEIYSSARMEYADMPAYPEEGYILETDERIIVKIYD